jgi:hypothetical protein
MFMHLFEHRRKEMPVNGIDGGDAHMPRRSPRRSSSCSQTRVKSFFQLLAACRSSSPAAVSAARWDGARRAASPAPVPRAKSDGRWKTPRHAAPLTLYETTLTGHFGEIEQKSGEGKHGLGALFLQRVVRIKALDATVLSQYRSIHSGETIVSPIFSRRTAYAQGSFLLR